jgi:hypothetical protein
MTLVTFFQQTKLFGLRNIMSYLYLEIFSTSSQTNSGMYRIIHRDVKVAAIQLFVRQLREAMVEFTIDDTGLTMLLLARTTHVGCETEREKYF